MTKRQKEIIEKYKIKNYSFGILETIFEDLNKDKHWDKYYEVYHFRPYDKDTGEKELYKNYYNIISIVLKELNLTFSYKKEKLESYPQITNPLRDEYNRHHIGHYIIFSK